MSAITEIGKHATRAVIYTRLSLDREGTGLGVERQREDCEAECVRNGWEVVDVLCDNDTSATDGKHRAGYESALALIEGRRADVLVAYSQDRLVRRMADLERLVTVVDGAGASIVLVRGGSLDLSSASSRTVARILGAIAQGEVEQKVERQVRARRQAAEQGMTNVGGARPFGYLDDKLTPHPTEGPALSAAVRSIASGASLRQVMREWTEQGVTPVKGGPWRYSSLTALLTRPRNAGHSVHRGQVVGVGQWQPLVSEDEHRQVCAVLANPDRRTTTASTARWLLSNIGACGECGAPLTSGSSRSRGRTTRIYKCSTGKPHGARKAERVDEYVADVVMGRLSRPDALDLLRRPAPDTAPLLAEAAAIEARTDQLLGDLAGGVLTAAEFREVKDRLSERAREIGARLAVAAAAGSTPALPTSRELWDSLPIDRKRAVLRALVRVSLHKQGTPFGDEPYGCLIEWVA